MPRTKNANSLSRSDLVARLKAAGVDNEFLAAEVCAARGLKMGSGTLDGQCGVWFTPDGNWQSGRVGLGATPAEATQRAALLALETR